MSPSGAADLLVASRAALLDALEALAEQRNALVLIGAQAIYLHTGAVVVGLAASTKDSDLVLDTRRLADTPMIDDAMWQAGFRRDLVAPQPGAWLSTSGVPVDLMVPEALAGSPGRRGVDIPPHSRYAARRAVGLEAAVVDHAPMAIAALDSTDARSCTIEVAGPAALLVAKLHKLGERRHHPDRLLDKDAHDIYRLLVATDTHVLARRLVQLRVDDLAGDVTGVAMRYFEELFAVGPAGVGSVMAGRAEQLVGDPDVISAAVSALADDLVQAMANGDRGG